MRAHDEEQGLTGTLEFLLHCLIQPLCYKRERSMTGEMAQYSSSRESGFNSQHPHQVPDNHLQLQLQGDPMSLTSAGTTLTYPNTCIPII